MRRGRSPRGSRQARQQSQRAGQDIELHRGQLAISTRDVAARSGVARSTVERVVSGDPSVQVDTLCAVADAVGLDVVIKVYERQTPGLRDTGQLELANQLRAEARSAWRSSLEVRAGDHGEAADQVFFGLDEILHVEIERMILDFQAQYRRAARKRDYLAAQHGRPVRLVLALEDTRRNRRAVAIHEELIASELPAATREIMRCLRSGQPLGRDGLAWVRRRRQPQG